MPLPFRKTFRKPGVRRILLPFTLGLVLLGFVACNTIGS